MGHSAAIEKKLRSVIKTVDYCGECKYFLECEDPDTLNNMGAYTTIEFRIAPKKCFVKKGV